jgi:hypothetical protein
MQRLSAQKRRWYWDEEDLPDAFEPQYMLEALLRRTTTGEPLERRKTISLGHLIFGQDTWRSALEVYDLKPHKVRNESDALTTMFEEAGMP